MTPEEIDRAWLLVNKYGPANSWTAANGTLAAALGRALKEIERLRGAQEKPRRIETSCTISNQ